MLKTQELPDERIPDEAVTAHYMEEPSDEALLADYEMREFRGLSP